MVKRPLIVLIQARVNSTRLKGKIFFDLFDEKVIDRIIRIAKKIELKKKIYLLSGSKKKNYIPLAILFTFSIYCSLAIDQSIDEQFHLLQGKITFDYLFSLGNIDKEIAYGKYYSTIYWSLLYFITELFPTKYETEVIHLVNLIFSISAIFGIGKVSKELFNKQVGKIIFIILFLYPIFFDQETLDD